MPGMRPASDAHPSGPARGAGGALPAGAEASINILIVDDEPKNLTVLETVLDNPGYRLVRAESADEALLALVAEEFALLILDIRMPGMTGFELAHTIKGRKKTALVPIIFLTAYYNEDQHVLEGYGKGAVDYLHKPINAAVLRSKVEVFADLHRKGRALGRANVALQAEVAERRRAEDSLRELNEVLDQRVTERTQALGASESRYRTLFHSIDEGFGVIDLQLDASGRAVDGEFVDCNLAFEKHSGLDAVVGRRLRELMPSIETDWLTMLGGVATTGVAVRRSGPVESLSRYVEVYAFRLGGAESRRVAVLFRDITDNRRTQEALRERERFLSTVTGATRIGLAVIEPGEVYRYANAAYAEIFGLSPAEVVGSTVARVLGPAWPVTQPHLRQAFAGERASFEVEVASAAGRPRHFAAYIELHIDQNGARTAVAVLVEITHLKQLESELRDIDRRKDEFLATLAHELRNPLAPVRNAVHLLHLKGDAGRELQWARDVIERQVGVMSRLIDDLMDVSRINQGRIELQRERVDLSEVLRWAVDASRPQLDESGHRFTIALPGEPMPLDADLTRLSQVFMNLLTNAAKYTDRGGHVELSAVREGQGVVVTVSDDGIGIAADQLRNVFTMFSQVDDALSRARGGLGIGLSLAKRLTELHGGRIEARSAGLGRGSQFVVWLPVFGATPLAEPRAWARGSSATVPALAVDEPRPATTTATATNSDTAPLTAPVTAADTATPPAAGLRILVVDDNRDGADSVAAVLSMLGHEVRAAYEGEAALREVEAFQPAVVLLDIGLPKLNGYEVCRRIREREGGAAVTVIAMTGWGDEKARQHGKASGFDRHLVKPVDPALLLETLAELGPRR